MALSWVFPQPVPPGGTAAASPIDDVSGDLNFLAFRPQGRLYAASAGQSIPSGAFTAVTMSGAYDLQYGMAASGGGLLLPSPGLYFVTAQVNLSFGSSGSPPSVCSIGVSVGTAGARYSAGQQRAFALGEVGAVVFADLLRITTAGSVLLPIVFQNGSAACSIYGGDAGQDSYISASLVSL